MLKVLLVDDEKLALMEMQRLLGQIGGVEVVGCASNGNQALEMISSCTPDLVLLDIRMPEMSGLEFAKQVPANLNFVFCTAYSEHAVEAFELNAIDYLMKPIQKERLESVINKVACLVENKPSVPDSSLHFLPEEHGLLLKVGQGYQIVKIRDINRIESVGNHIAIYADGHKMFLHVSLSKVEKKLNPNHFLKASRSDIIRISNIKKIEDGLSSGTFTAILQGGEEIEISRRQAHAIRKVFSLDALS